MSEENLPARFASHPAPKLTPGHSYLGRFTSDGSVEVFGNNANDLTDVAFVIAAGSVSASLSNYSGNFVTGMFVVVYAGDGGGVGGIEFDGVHYAWMESFETDGVTGWAMTTEGGLEWSTTCPDGSTGGCDPFREPLAVPPPSLTEVVIYAIAGEPVFVAAEDGWWRNEYQACAADDDCLDSPPGIRSAWNMLAPNCCCGTNDEIVGDSDDGGDNSPCIGVNLNCRMIAKMCHKPGLPSFIYWTYCFDDDAMNCAKETGNRCACSGRYDVDGNEIPLPASLPPGTVIFTKCSSAPEVGWPKCSTLLSGGYECDG